MNRSETSGVAPRNPQPYDRGLPQSHKKQQLQRQTKQKSMKERETFLMALLREEMEDLDVAQQERVALEQQLGILGTSHIKELLRDPEVAEAVAAASGSDPSLLSSLDFSRLSKEQQYALALEELKYVAARPVGSKRNIIRLHYLVDEVSRAKAAASSSSSSMKRTHP